MARVEVAGSGFGDGRPAQGEYRGARALVAVLCAACLFTFASARGAAAEGPDTLRFRLETGVSTDFTNELYYQDAFVDTTFLGRQLASTPESRYAGVLSATLDGPPGGRRASYQIQNELSLGDKVQRDALSMNWRDELAPGWRLALAPALEWRHDRTFDRDQEEWRGSFRGRLRRNFADDANAAEFGVCGDIIRTSGLGSEFMLDRNAGRGWLAVEHLGLLGDEWRLGYGFASRVFPDSSERDHYEHGWEGRLRHLFAGGHALTLELTGQRRQTQRVVTATRDNFWQHEAIAEADLRAADRWGVRVRLEGEVLQYDVQDSTVFFDYLIARARVAARYESGARWTLAAGPRAEFLTDRLNPGEEYHEIGGALEFESIGLGALWSVIPAAGWRAYDPAAATGLSDGQHSSFAFYELDAFVDQPLVNGLRLRALTGLRYESHTDPTQNAGSVYGSVQVRWAAR